MDNATADTNPRADAAAPSAAEFREDDTAADMQPVQAPQEPAAPDAIAEPAPAPATRAPDDSAPQTPVMVETPPQPVAAVYDDTEVSQFDYEPPFQSRRNPLKLWTAAAAIFAAVAFGTIAAVSYWGLPDWVPVSRPTFAVNQPDLVLEFPPGQQDRRTLPNGTEFFGASGTITNVGRESHQVPSILIILRDERDRIVYSWEVAPPQPRLAPGEQVTINEAVTDVPRSAKFAEIGWKPG